MNRKSDKSIVLVFRIVTGAWLFGWYIRGLLFSKYFSESIFVYPVKFAFFPEIFLSPGVCVTAYYLPLVCLITFFSQRIHLFKLSSLIMIFSSFILLIHINTFNDAMSVASFWVALWLFWYASQMKKEDVELCFHARVLAQCLLGIIFLGGFVGKLTGAYYSGEAICGIFIAQTKLSPLGLLAGFLPGAGKISAAAWASKLIILGEGALSLSPLLPFRIVCILALAIVPMLTLFSTWQVLSVISAPMGMLLACLLLKNNGC